MVQAPYAMTLKYSRANVPNVILIYMLCALEPCSNCICTRESQMSDQTRDIYLYWTVIHDMRATRVKLKLT